jgi:tetratricopeptide (TPR) repeat protein
MRRAASCGTWMKKLPGEKLKRLALTMAFIISFCQIVLGEQSPNIDGLFRKGNESFAGGDFRSAIQHYSAIVAAGFIHEAVFYNLGNAYFKDGQMGKAILYYEKAAKLVPQDREINENLTLARSRIVDKVETPQPHVFFRVLSRLRGGLPLDMETGVAAGLFALANLIYSFHLLKKSGRGKRILLRLAMAFLSVSLLVGISNAIRIYQDRSVRDAIVLGEKVDVLSGPGSDHSSLFSVHDGLKVTIQNDVGEWSQIRLENGWNGWVKKEVLGLI